MSKYRVAVGENYVETITVEADNEEEAIDEALSQSDFNEPEFLEFI